MRGRGPIGAFAVTVTRQLPADRRRRPSQAPGDGADRRAAGTAQCDLFSFAEGQVSPLQVAPAARAHATGLTHPSQTALTVAARDGRGVGHELTGLPCGPERLNQLSHQLVRETHCHRHPHILGVATTARTQGSGYGDRGQQFRLRPMRSNGCSFRDAGHRGWRPLARSAIGRCRGQS